MIYLSKQQMLQLMIPMIVAGTFFFFEDDIIHYMHITLPQHSMKESQNVNKEAASYLKISRDMQVYSEIVNKIQQREMSLEWLGSNFLYKNAIKQSSKDKDKRVKEKRWKLEAVFPKHNMAIINSQFVQKNSSIDKAKVIKITFDSVLLKTKKGLQWVHLFH